MSKIRFVNALLCDHASISSGNKHTLVNVYSGDILVSSLPANILMSAYLEIEAPITGTLDFKLKYQLNSEMIVSIDAHAEGLIKGAIGVLVMPSIPLGLTKPGTLRLIAEADGFARTVAIKKEVLVGLIA